MTPADLTPLAWVLLATGAAFVGFAKTAVGGVGALAVVLFALALPAKESTGALLPLLLVGDLFAVRFYHRHANWSMLIRLLPGVLPGLVLGAWFLAVADDELVRRSIGAILLVMTAAQLWVRYTSARTRTSEVPATPHPHHGRTIAMGVAAGFATMTANAAGPVMTLYLVLAGLPMLEMLGTAAWFFLFVNAAKVPFSVGLDLISVESLTTDLLLVPALALGAVGGVAVVRRISQAQFERAVLGLGAVAAVVLLVA